MNKYLFGIKSALGCVYRGTQEAMKSWDTRIRTRFAYYYKNCKVRDNVVLYESFYGKGMLCNPYAIFLELINNPEFKHFKHIWVLKEMDQDPILLEKYKGNKNVIFVKYHSKEYLKALCTAKYLFNNSTFANYYIKKPEQIYVNTWHGIPLKTLGYDIPNGNIESGNVVRNFLQTDYMISASPFLTKIYQEAYKLEHLYKGKIIEEGYPRLDTLSRFDRNTLFEKLHSYGVEADPNKKVILFAPTWRGTNFAHASSDITFCYELKERLEQIIDTNEYQILVKLHQQVYSLCKDSITEKYFVPSMIDANEVLAVTDILINDFSSIYFDFLATNRPILFFIPDLETYTQQRGLYRSPDCLPGPCTGSLDQLGEWINNIDAAFASTKDKYDAERDWSNGNCCSGIAAKIVDIVFRGHEEGYKICYPNLNKERILISRGSMRVNGISTSLLSFLNNLDYDRFDVTLMVMSSSKADEKKLLSRINPNVRVLARNSANCITIGERIRHIYYGRTWYKNPFHPMYLRDVRRSYGDVEFDHVIDFDGYNTYFSTLLLQFKNAQHCIWQHSDIVAERDLRFPWLENQFKLYKHFHKIVSCAYDVMLVNREKLASYCDGSKFTYVKNAIDVERITGCIEEGSIKTYDGQSYIQLDETVSNGTVRLSLLPHLTQGADGQRLYKFVAMGRCSPEKNYENLVTGFEMLQKEFPNAYLYILGDGPEKKKVDALINKLGIRDHVFTPGNLSNPFAVLKHCDCFILPSLHEGQPMVINEARMLKLPIIVSNFSSVNGVLVENGQLVIEREAQDIYEGMKKFILGQMPTTYKFDAAVYNKQAYEEFLNALK